MTSQSSSPWINLLSIEMVACIIIFFLTGSATQCLNLIRAPWFYLSGFSHADTLQRLPPGPVPWTQHHCTAEVWSLQMSRLPLCQGHRETAEHWSRWPQTGISLRWQTGRGLRLTEVPTLQHLGPNILTDQFWIQQGPEIPLRHNTNREGPTWQDISGGCCCVCVCVSCTVSLCPLLTCLSH